ncbi:MAG: hypothetical protein E6713_10920 [Sporomusaceae bacterium]|nr:hypothetical protein [Sporomusaceae bacterium]
MENTNYIKEKILQLIQTPPVFGEERIPGGLADYERLAPEWLSSLSGIDQLEADAWHRNDAFVLKIKYLREAIFRLGSLECAAGASAERCRLWFACLALLLSQKLVGENYPIDSEETVTFFALTRDFSLEHYRDWPEKSDYEGVASRILYGLMTGYPVVLPTENPAYDDRHWLQLYRAIMQKNATDLKQACMALADYWLHDYAVNEVPVFDQEQFPCFEADCNAILAIALYREQISVVFEEEKYRQFYLAALL